jgi:stage II sporulation SpoAA-like protein
MPITWVANGNRADIVFSDPYTLGESEKVMRAIFADPDMSRPLRFLVDVRKSTPPDSEFVGNAVTFWQVHISHMWGARIAVVAATDSQKRMGRLSEDTAESRELPFTIRVFAESEFDAAKQWLEQANDGS